VSTTRPDVATAIEPDLLGRIHAIMARPYHILLTPLPPDDGEGFFIRVLELPGCMSDGASPAEAYEHLQEAMEGWLAVALERGIPIPEPASDDDPGTGESGYSGRFMTRVPRSVHRRLSQRAQAENISLNQLVLSYLAEGLAAHR
jgi:antitoxin HicB